MGEQHFGIFGGHTNVLDGGYWNKNVSRSNVRKIESLTALEFDIYLKMEEIQVSKSSQVVSFKKRLKKKKMAKACLIFVLSLESTVLLSWKFTQGWRLRNYAKKSYTIQKSPSSSETLTFQKKCPLMLRRQHFLPGQMTNIRSNGRGEEGASLLLAIRCWVEIPSGGLPFFCPFITAGTVTAAPVVVHWIS